MSLQSCSIEKVDKSACHMTVHTHRKTGLLTIIELSHENFELLVWKTGIQKNALETVFLHQLIIYVDKFTILNPFCCDPFGNHLEKKNYKGSKLISNIEFDIMEIYTYIISRNCNNN